VTCSNADGDYYHSLLPGDSKAEMWTIKFITKYQSSHGMIGFVRLENIRICSIVLNSHYPCFYKNMSQTISYIKQKNTFLNNYFMACNNHCYRRMQAHKTVDKQITLFIANDAFDIILSQHNLSLRMGVNYNANITM
jgi:hypothetical protein